MSRKAKFQGFTLVEMSIVLVIIALVIGAVLVGRDMMASAVVRSDIALAQQLTAAVRTFKEKYRCLPGDCSTAIQFGWRPSGGWYDNGNGDERIGRNNGSISANECMNFWHHLGKAGLIGDSYSGFTGSVDSCSGQGISPAIAGGKGWVATIGNGYSDSLTESQMGNLFYLSSRRTTDSYYFPVYTAIQGYNIDIKIDDGKPASGLVRTGSIYHSVTVANTSYWNDGCVVLPSDTYDVQGAYVQNSGSAETISNPNSIDCIIVWGRAY